MRRWIVVVMVIIVALVGWRVLGSSRRTAREVPPAPAEVPVEVVRAQQQTLVDTVAAGGTIEAVAQVKIASKITGRVAAVFAREGDAVRAGQVVVRLDSSDIAAQVAQVQAAVQAARAGLLLVEQGARPQQRAQAETAVSAAKANLDNAQANLVRSRELYEAGAISKVLLDAAQTQYDVARSQYEAAVQQRSLIQAGPRTEEVAVARAQVGQAEAALQYARLQVQNTVIATPIGGVVTKRSIDPGELASSGTTLLVVATIDTVDVALNVSETDLNKMRSGQSVQLQTDAVPGKVFSGTVREIGPAGNTSTRTFAVKARVANPDRLLRPGMFARGVITVGRTESAVVIPRDAVASIAGDGAATIFTLAGPPPTTLKTGTARLRKVRLGQPYGAVVQVRSGLAAGELVIVTGLADLRDGTPVVVPAAP